MIYISLLTCTPGQPLYSRYGHTAIRVQDTERGMDVVFNYGIFSFETDHFYWKFVRGETYYQLGAEDTYYFLKEYQQEGRKVYEQRLNLSEDQTQQLLQALWTNYQPENRTYLYNFVFDNCATRPYRLLQKALDDECASEYEGWKGQTYRQFIHHYTGKGGWADFGINLIFGKRADHVMDNEARLFLPEELMDYIQQVKLKDGRSLVGANHIAPFTIAKVPWYGTWYVGIALVIGLFIGVNVFDRKRQKMSWGVDLALGSVYMMLIGLIVFLRFFSIHPLVGFSWRLLVIPFIYLCIRLIYWLR